MKKRYQKFLSNFFWKSTFLKKIAFSIMKNNKLRIFYSSLLLLLASFLISISINLPVNIENYKNIVLNQNNPYKSVVYYQSNPYNSPNFSFKNRDISPEKILDKVQVFDDNNRVNKFIKPTFDTFDPFNKEELKKYHINGKDAEELLPKILCLSFLSGQVWDKYFIDELNNNINPDNPLSQIICKMTGDPNENDKFGECVTWMIKHNAPSYIAKNLKNPNFSLNFGAAPFTDSKEELFTKINGLINNKHDEADIWGIDFSNTRLNLKKYQNIIDSEKNNDYLPVLINKTLARNYKLKTGDKIYFNYLYDQVNITKDNSSNPLDIKQLSSKFVTPAVNPDSDLENVGKWNYDGKKEDLLTDSDASSFYYNQDNYFCLNSNNYLKDGKISESKIPANKNLKVVGITNDYGYERFYTEKSLLNELLEPEQFKKSDPVYYEYFAKKFFNSKLSEFATPQDFVSYSVFQPYGDYSPLGLNGGEVVLKDNQNDSSLNFDQKGLGSINSLFSNEMFDNAYNSLLIALSILFIVIICLSIGISLIIIAVTNSNILQDNKKNLFVMKALGYKDREINNIISKIYTYILFFVYFVSLISVYFCTIYALNFIFSTNEIFVPSTFKLWEIPIGILLLFIVYYVNKIISFNIIKKLNLSSELKK